MEKRPLYTAINKYGPENFFVETLEECDDSILSDRETHWIEQLGTYRNGYNATLGGDGKSYIDYEEIESIYLKCLCVKETAKRTGHDDEMISSYVRSHHLPESKYIDVHSRPNCKPVGMYSKDNALLQTFNSINEAERWIREHGFIGHKTSCHIGEVCAGSRKTTAGFKWRFLDN